MSALKSALNVALNAALKRKPWKIMHSRQTGKRPPKHSSGNSMGTLKGRPLWHRWSKATVVSVNRPWWWDFLNANTTLCSVGIATSMHPLKKLTTNPQNFSLRKTLFSDQQGSAATNSVTVCTSRFSPSLIHGSCAFFASNSRFMRLFQGALDTPLDSPFSATLSVHGLHFTVYAPSKWGKKTELCFADFVFLTLRRPFQVLHRTIQENLVCSLLDLLETDFLPLP